MSQRIKAITEAATSLFLKQGYSKTQIGHIAKEVGVSVGTIYHDFAGKKEIMHFVLKCTLDPDFINCEIETPITDDLFCGLEEEIVKRLAQTGEEFALHLNGDGEDYSFEMFISDAFDLLTRYAVGCLFIEKNQFDFPYLTEHYKAYRKQFFQTMTRYINLFMEKGTVRRLENVELSTVLIIEILSWWAMDVHYTAFETSNISNEAAKQVCMDNIISAYKI